MRGQTPPGSPLGTLSAMCALLHTVPRGSLCLQCPSAPFPAGTPPHRLKEAQHRAEVPKTLLTKLFCQGQGSTTTGMSAALVSSGFHFLKYLLTRQRTKYTSFSFVHPLMTRNVTTFPVWFYDHFKDEEKRQRVLELPQRLQSDLSGKTGLGSGSLKPSVTTLCRPSSAYTNP